MPPDPGKWPNCGRDCKKSDYSRQALEYLHDFLLFYQPILWGHTYIILYAAGLAKV